jgi:hypothetical protein
MCSGTALPCPSLRRAAKLFSRQLISLIQPPQRIPDIALRTQIERMPASPGARRVAAQSRFFSHFPRQQGGHRIEFQDDRLRRAQSSRPGHGGKDCAFAKEAHHAKHRLGGNARPSTQLSFQQAGQVFHRLINRKKFGHTRTLGAWFVRDWLGWFLSFHG